MNRILRAHWHDYTERCIYMVTLNKDPLTSDFGILEGDYRIPAGQKGSPFVSAAPIGKAIKDVLGRFSHIEPKLRVFQYALMPDHLHILIFVEQKTDEILGRIIARFKVEVDRIAGFNGVFAKGFNDQILKSTRSLDVIYSYIRDNARRLAVRKAHPEFFRRINSLTIGGKQYQAYGNFQLLDCPFKEQVVVHRADSPQTRRENRERWLYNASNGGVLVSPFISPDEKAIRAEAEASGGRFIFITAPRMEERYKPSGRDFELCESGRMLIISADCGSDLSRQACLTMNALAAEISSR